MWPFKKKKKNKAKFECQFLCKTCDVFFYREYINDDKCPICGRRMELWGLEELKEGKIDEK